jgi:hypothetical protein
MFIDIWASTGGAKERTNASAKRRRVKETSDGSNAGQKRSGPIGNSRMRGEVGDQIRRMRGGEAGWKRVAAKGAAADCACGSEWGEAIAEERAGAETDAKGGAGSSDCNSPVIEAGQHGVTRAPVCC